LEFRVGVWNDFKRVSPEREARVREADALAGVRRRDAEYAETQRNLGVREWSSEQLRVSPFWENRSIFRSAHGSAMKG